MGSRPVVSVCIPTRNRAGHLAVAVRSVLRQTFTDIEVVVLDNASTDGTEEFVRSLDDPRITYLRHPRNIGLFANMTRCLTAGTGRYRVVLPDDDSMLPDNLRRKVEFLEARPGVGLVHSAFRTLDPGGEPVGAPGNWTRLTADTVETGVDFLRRSISLGGVVCAPSVMLRSDLVAGECYDPDDGPYADMALWLRLATRCEVGFLAEPLSGYLVHAASASSGYGTVREANGRTVLTLRHADAIRQAHGRFLARASLPRELRSELRSTLRRSDARMRLSIAANQVLDPGTLARAKQGLGWRPGGLLHRGLSLDALRDGAADRGPQPEPAEHADTVLPAAAGRGAPEGRWPVPEPGAGAAPGGARPPAMPGRQADPLVSQRLDMPLRMPPAG